MATILLVMLILLLIGALPTRGHSRDWGRGPSGIPCPIPVISAGAIFDAPHLSPVT